MIFEGENNMSTLDLIINSSKKFYECLNNDENGRFTNPDKRNFTLGIVKVGRIMGNRCIILL